MFSSCSITFYNILVILLHRSARVITLATRINESYDYPWYSEQVPAKQRGLEHLYVEQLTFYFAANGVTEDKQQSSILLANCGTATFKLIKSLLEAGKIQTTPFKDLVALVQNHYEPKPSVIVQRYKFNNR